jgi:hypothetical protein
LAARRIPKISPQRKIDMPTSFDVFYLGTLAIIDPAEGNQNVSTTAVDSWLGTYGGPGNGLSGNIQSLTTGGTGFSGGQSTRYDINNSASNDQFVIDGVVKTFDASMVFNATLTYSDGTTATISAVLAQTEDGDVYLMPEFSANQDQSKLEAKPLQSITLNSPIYGARVNGRGYNLNADRQDSNFIPCFTPGTAIATPRGEVAVELLAVGDKVFTRDNGIQKILWMGGRKVTPKDLAQTPGLQPVMIQAGALGPNLPETDLLVSPNHRILMAGGNNALYFEESEVLAAAKHLVHLDGIDVVEAVSGVEYIHIMFASHEVVLSNGAWTESFQPGEMSLRGIGSAQRAELFELFPELITDGVNAYGAARTTLRRHEAKLLS